MRRKRDEDGKSQWGPVDSEHLRFCTHFVTCWPCSENMHISVCLYLTSHIRASLSLGFSIVLLQWWVHFCFKWYNHKFWLIGLTGWLMGTTVRNPRNQVKYASQNPKLLMRNGTWRQENMFKGQRIWSAQRQTRGKWKQTPRVSTTLHMHTMVFITCNWALAKLLWFQGSMKNQDPQIFSIKIPHKTLNSGLIGLQVTRACPWRGHWDSGLFFSLNTQPQGQHLCFEHVPHCLLAPPTEA